MLARGRGAAHGEFLARLGEIAFELFTFIEKRSQPPRQLFKWNFKLAGGSFGDFNLFLSRLARGAAGQSLDAAHA